MDTLNKIEHLFQQAAQQPTPVFGVGDKVMKSLNEADESENFLTFDVFAAISAVAATLFLFWAISAWLTISDPMNVLVEPLQEVALW